MKRLAVAALLMAVLPSIVFAVQFSPTALRINAGSIIQYDFNGTDLSFPVTVSGTPAEAVFFVFTKDKAESILNIRNGFLGWHYVNKIDTCIYVSGKTQLTVGQNTITWNGKDNDDNMVPSGEYTYYIWGFDNYSVRQQILPETVSFGGNQRTSVYQYDETGVPLANPIVQIQKMRWVVGNDPKDATLLETTALPDIGSAWAASTDIAFQLDDWSTIYMVNCPSATEAKLLKFKYVPNGICEQVPNFVVEWSQLTNRSDIQLDADYIYCGENNYKMTEARQLIHVIDYRVPEGTHEATIDMTDWTYTPDDYAKGGLMNSGLRNSLLFNGYYYAHNVSSCQKLVFDMDAWKNGDDFNDTVRFINQNGDYIYDHNFQPDSPRPWVCNDAGVAPESNSWPVDINGFSTQSAQGLGAVSFYVLAPDGTGAGLFTTAGELEGVKASTLIIDYGSPYDGILLPNVQQVYKQPGEPGLYWLAMDSTKGIITSNPVNVESTTPSEFSVTQNVPNPFNPTTTISFALPAASHVTIDVFNVAGQKVDTITNDYLTAGNHSVVWEATGFSAGVYFYSIHAGDFSKTMKMTLLK